MSALSTYRKKAVTWQENDDPEFPYVADVDGRRWMIRMNDFPEEQLYTLLIEGDEVESFNDWPRPSWQRPEDGA